MACASTPARQRRQHADEALMAQMRDYHDEFDATIGVRRMHAEINEHAPTRVNHKRIERLMRQRQIVGVNLRKKKRTTIPDQDAKVFDADDGDESVFFPPPLTTTCTDLVMPLWKVKGAKIRDPKPAWTAKHLDYERKHYPEK